MKNKEYTVKRLVKTITTHELLKKYVNYEQTEEYCKACPKYETNYSCPPFQFNTNEYLKNYDYIELTVTQITFSGKLRQKSYTPTDMEELLDKTFFYEEKKTQKELFNREKEYISAESLIGPCNNCGLNCKNNFNTCQHPNLRRYSTESMGMKIDKILTDLFNIKMEFLEERIPEYTFENQKINNNKTKLIKTMNSVMGLLYTTEND